MPIIHPNWDRPAANMVDGFSLEITAKDIAALTAAAPAIPPDTPIAITFLPGEEVGARIAATKTVRSLGFEPMPHFSARRIASTVEFESYLEAVVDEAGVRRCFVIAGDPTTPAGPFNDSSALIGSGAFEKHGIRAIGVGGHPEGHPNMSKAQCMEVLQAKSEAISQRGMACLIVTQFSFDARPVLNWLLTLREAGIHAPARIGVPGPAGIKTLMRFAARCGVGASAAVLANYGISLGKLIGSTGPDRLVEDLKNGLGEEHGAVRLHFYPFGGLEKTVGWITDYDRAYPSSEKLVRN